MQKPAAGKSLYCQCGKSVSTVLIMVSLWYNLWHLWVILRIKRENILVFLVLYGKAQPLTCTVLYTFYLQMVPLSHTYL